LSDPTPDTTEPAPLEIPRDHHDAMVAHCLREAPLECCGLLGGFAARVTSFYPMRNAAASPSAYYADERDLIAVHRTLRERGEEILAIYHSHPRWEAVPSRTDLRENYYGPVPRIIVSLLDDVPVVRVWRLDLDSYEELPWRIVDPEEPEPGHQDAAAWS
jgi:proteasome lid subunit RPN8/RPN11